MPRRTLAQLGGLALILSTLWMPGGSEAQEGSTPEQIHDELRALKDRAVKAVNGHDKDGLMRELAPEVTFTAMNNDVIHGLDNIKSYYDQMLGASRLIEDMSMTVEADDLSRLYAANQVAVATGKADTHFKIAGGKEFDWPLRWTATLTRANNKWSVVALHFSGNAISNPLITASKVITYWAPWAFGVVGLVLGFIAARLMGRRRKA